MGVQGLRRYIEALAVLSQLRDPRAATSTAGEKERYLLDHVCIDMNSVIHEAYSRAACVTEDTCIQRVIEALLALLETFVAMKSVVVVIDGVAPVAKWNTQRQRRRKLGVMDVRNANTFSDLCFTVGMPFMTRLQEEVFRALHGYRTGRMEAYRRSAAHGNACHDDPDTCVPYIVLDGHDVPGEGEVKLVSHLNSLAAHGGHDVHPDSVLIIGNDIDLVLTTMAATGFNNYYVLNHRNMQLISVGSLVQRWCCPTAAVTLSMDPLTTALAVAGGSDASAAGLGPARQRQIRIDFIFIISMSGGDYFSGLGDVAVDLWKRYRAAIGSSGQPIVRDNFTINAEMLLLLIGNSNSDEARDQGSKKKLARAHPGVQFLRAVQWATRMIVSGNCPDPTFVYECPTALTIATVREALRKHKSYIDIMEPNKHETQPPTAFEARLALTPTLGWMPAAIRNALRNEQSELLNPTRIHNETPLRALLDELFASNSAVRVAELAHQVAERVADDPAVAEEAHSLSRLDGTPREISRGTSWHLKGTRTEDGVARVSSTRGGNCPPPIRRFREFHELLYRSPASTHPVAASSGVDIVNAPVSNGSFDAKSAAKCRTVAAGTTRPAKPSVPTEGPEGAKAVGESPAVRKRRRVHFEPSDLQPSRRKAAPAKAALTPSGGHIELSLEV